jgi:uncharacterized damage-inducible protein DinB
MMEAMLNEMRQEAQATRRLLDRVPEDKLAWKPHVKSMSLGQLAWHVAAIPGDLSRLAQMNEFDASNANFEPPMPQSKQAVLEAFEKSQAEASEYLASLTSEEAAATWRLTHRGNEVFAMPRAAVLRSVLLNHWYHHRGQLCVYLRLLDVPIPVIYGRSADENPFA